MEWTEETIGTLRSLWADGHSTAEIGRRMGISKNAVVGKAHRLNLSSRPSPIRRDEAAGRAVPTHQPAPAPRPVAPPTERPVAESRVTERVVVERAPERIVAERPPAPRTAVHAPPETAPRLVAPRQVPAPVVRAFPRIGSRSCCWPIGEPGTPEFRFCTSEAASGRPYCAEHASIAYVKVRDRREDAA